MKECKYCRTQYDDELPVCPNCGASKVISEDELSEEAEMIQREAEYRREASDMYRIRKHWHIAIIVSILLIIGIGICLLIFEKSAPLSNGMTQDEGNQMFSAGVDFLQQGEYEAAIGCFNQLPSDSSQYMEAQSLLVESKDSYRIEILNQIDTYISNQQFDSAFNLFSQAQRILPDDPELQNAYDGAYSAYSAMILGKVNTYTKNGQYEVALEYLNGIKASYPDDMTFQTTYDSVRESYKEVVKTDAIQESESLAAEGDLPRAITILEAALEKVGEDIELSAHLETRKKAYCTQIITQADEALSKEGYQVAIDIATNGLRVLPSDDELKSKISEYETYQPVDLFGLETFRGNPGSKVGTLIDTFGNKYDQVYLTATNVGDEEILYTLNGEYKELYGSLLWSKDYKDDETGYIALQFYDGERLLFATPQCSAESTPVDFSVDISNIKTLTIKFRGFSSEGPFVWGSTIFIQK